MDRYISPVYAVGGVVGALGNVWYSPQEIMDPLSKKKNDEALQAPQPFCAHVWLTRGHGVDL